MLCGWVGGWKATVRIKPITRSPFLSLIISHLLWSVWKSIQTSWGKDGVWSTEKIPACHPASASRWQQLYKLFSTADDAIDSAILPVKYKHVHPSLISPHSLKSEKWTSYLTSLHHAEGHPAEAWLYFPANNVINGKMLLPKYSWSISLLCRLKSSKCTEDIWVVLDCWQQRCKRFSSNWCNNVARKLQTSLGSL